MMNQKDWWEARFKNHKEVVSSQYNTFELKEVVEEFRWFEKWSGW